MKTELHSTAYLVVKPPQHRRSSSTTSACSGSGVDLGQLCGGREIDGLSSTAVTSSAGARGRSETSIHLKAVVANSQLQSG